MGELFHAIAVPLYWVISGILVLWHKILAGLPFSAGWVWALSVVGMTLTIRALLIPVFVKQLNGMRDFQHNMAVLQPQLASLKKKYAHDRERFAQEQMKLFKDNDVNPLGGCLPMLPMLLMMPMFLALFHVLRNAAQDKGTSWLSTAEAKEFGHAHWLGTTLGSTMTGSGAGTWTIVIALILLALMSGAMWFQMHQMRTKNSSPAMLTGQNAQVQKIMANVMPLTIVLFSFSFQIGLMIYWTVSNSWTWGQQAVLMYYSPTPGSPAAHAKAERERAKGHDHSDLVLAEEAAEMTVEDERPAQRAQPKRQTKAQRQAGNKTPKKKDD